VLKLPQVTLCCVDAKNHALALRALARSRRDIEFARSIFLTDAVPEDVDVPHGIEVISIGAIPSHEAYSRIILKELQRHIETSHVLLVQWDGYVVHPESWSSEFLDCDYVGAPWPDGNGGYTVGNGGFSLRSRKLLTALQDARFQLMTKTEDVTICRHHRRALEGEFDIRFGTPEIALRFSFEIDASPVLLGAKTFGFHGLFNLFAVESQADIIKFVSSLSDSHAMSQMADLLLKNLVKFGLYSAALALGGRILECKPESEVIASELIRAREGLEQQATQRGFGLAARLLSRFRGAH
jgi:hypothetical protein